ncbi:hypothetical protein M9Y10_022610 [Tritrichomonas musculus]|uniref:Uncharacterized protein n=1 Tax=Tritrichomonas musculus TaxID=1915356 RepID=A0ABR2KTA9_9EUKA
MQKFNAESILALRDEPLKKDMHLLGLNRGKENQKVNLIRNNENDDDFINDMKEKNKKKFRRSVLRREAEKSLPKDDDLLWDPSFISISSLTQVQSNLPKQNENKFLLNKDSKIKNEPNTKEELSLSNDTILKSNNNEQMHRQASNEVTLGFLDEIIEICMALGRRPVKIAPIERLGRLESRSDFRFLSLVEVNYPTIGSICLRLTSNLSSAACDLAKKMLENKGTTNVHDLREFSALLSSLHMLNKVVSEAEQNKADHNKMISINSLRELVQTCLNGLNNNKNDTKNELSKIKEDIQIEVNKLTDKINEL